MPDATNNALSGSTQLKPSRLRWLVTFLICSSFVAICAWLGPSENPVLFWGGGGFFLLGALIAVPPVLGRGGSLVLDSEGFTCRTLLRSFRREWRECSMFHPVRIGLRKFVGFTTQQDEAAHPGIAAANRTIIGASGMLPDTFGLSAEELSDLMNRYRSRAFNPGD